MKPQRTFKILILFLIMLTFLSSLSGCSRIDNLKVKFGLKNNDFEYIKQDKVNKIVIQNIRDRGFRFVVTDKKAIRDLYDILSTAKEVKEKSSLEPDYIFEMYEGSKTVHKFSYIAGLDKKDAGNFYSDDKVYIVSKRIDNDVIKSFWNIRSPKDFQKIYYESIIEAVNKYIKDTNQDKSIGINLNDDIDVAKFIFSTDLEEFESNLVSKFKNTELQKKGKTYTIEVSMKTQGYRAYLYKGEYRYTYKAIMKFYDNTQKIEKNYYILDDYIDSGWDIKISSEKPDKF